MRWIFDGKQWLQAWQHQSSKLGRREHPGDGEHIWKDVREQLRIFHLEHRTFRRFHRRKEGTQTSSRRDGKIFLTLRPSENLSKTLVKPFMNEIFSSRLFAAKFDRSRKLRVDIGSDEKKECEGMEDEASLFVGCRVIKAFSIANGTSGFTYHGGKTDFTPCKSLSSPLIPVSGRPAASRRPPKLP